MIRVRCVSIGERSVMEFNTVSKGKMRRNYDLLEMNICDENEYRCMNGMCIPDQFFLDEEFDCLDWSDEILFKNNRDCPTKSVNVECDDRFCPPNRWSCGDGQCIGDRLAFQKFENDKTCRSGRDQYFLCETHLAHPQWTIANGRCVPGGRPEALLVTNRSIEEECEYLLKCALLRCVEKLEANCSQSPIRYPRRAIIAPYLIFLYNHTGNNQKQMA